MKKYVFEKDCPIPLCCIDDGVYIDYNTCKVINNTIMLDFIQKGIESKNMEIKKADFRVYQIIAEDGLVAYNYLINGISNYLTDKKIPINGSMARQYINDNLINGKYVQRLVWK